MSVEATKPDKGGALLSDIALGWMTGEAERAGLSFEQHLARRLKPAPTATLHDSSSLKFRSWKDTWRPIHPRKDMRIHQSVKERWEHDSRYRPANVQKYLDKHGWPKKLEP